MFDAVDEEFFAREAELWHAPRGESFDDLDPSAPSSPAPRGKRPPPRRDWFGLQEEVAAATSRTQSEIDGALRPGEAQRQRLGLAADRAASRRAACAESGSVQPREKIVAYG